jgi:CheY-like chemotaxis protein/anti-sigma regulatory factor (Ser/Thr protein kinase)
LHYTLEVDPAVPAYLEGDAGKLRQVLINLLSNAVKFTDKGGVWLRARLQPIADNSDMVKLLLEVEDSGPGIPQNQIDGIFDAFRQLSHSQKSGEGTGLGLAISKMLVEMMNGEISIESELGQGALLKVAIPFHLADAKTVAPVEEPVAEVVGLQADQPKWRILIVEDNIENRLLLSSLLRKAGFEIREVENGEEAIAQFHQWQPHLIWMDMRMPVMDGYAATAKIRSLPGGETVKIVAITASAFNEQRQDILAAGCDEVVHKPFKDHEIFEAMARLLDIKYLHKDMGAEAPPEQVINLTAEMLDGLPPELLQELHKATLALDREAIFAVIERIERLAPDTAKGLQTLMDNFQIGLIRDLLGENYEQ